MKVKGPFFVLVLVLALSAALQGVNHARLASLTSPSPLSTESPLPDYMQPKIFIGADGVNRITARELHRVAELGLVEIVDSRSNLSYRQKHIEGAISIPFNEVQQQTRAAITKLARRKLIVTYCT
jgi:hypothetical protein